MVFRCKDRVKHIATTAAASLLTKPHCQPTHLRLSHMLRQYLAERQASKFRQSRKLGIGTHWERAVKLSF